MKMGPHDGRIAVVAGAGRVIGQEYALALASDGATVVVADLDDELATETVKLVASSHGTALVAQQALKKEGEPRDLVAALRF
jgi:NAD(P)-dependent dehydrogenase (short-subunit alcohol dehydrogenase family)